ncbi:MAG: superoxide dismutase [Thermomicrobiales bacterium]
MAFELPALPYDVTALEPSIDAQTMTIHHDKHHAAYVNNLNAAIAGTDLEGKSLEALIRDINALPADKRGPVRNNGGGHWNHTMFWEIMGPGGGGAPTGALAAAIDAAFGSFDAMKEAVNKAGVGRFGSGWAWVIVGADGKLAITSTPNQDNPLMVGVADVVGAPILGVDVWEHAYYLKYQNRRPDYLAAWWETVNWDAVAKRYAHATK